MGALLILVLMAGYLWLVYQIAQRVPRWANGANVSMIHANEFSNTIPKHIYCDKGYKGHKQNGKDKPKIHLGDRIPKTATRTEKTWRKRRAAIESTIGHLKSDNRMGRNFLKGRAGNTINPILATACNFKKLLAWFSFAPQNINAPKCELCLSSSCVASYLDSFHA